MATVLTGSTTSSYFIAPGRTLNLNISGNDMTKYNSYSAGPDPGSPAGASVQTVTQWATTDGKIHIQYVNNGSAGVIFTPRWIEVSP